VRTGLKTRRLPAAMRRQAGDRAMQRALEPPPGPPWRVGHYDGPTDPAGQIEHAKFLATGLVDPIYWHNPGACLSLLMKAQALDIPRATAFDGIWWNTAIGKGAIHAQLMASLLVERHHYEFKVTEETDQRVAMTFYRTVNGRRRRLGDVEWTILEAIGACLTWREQWQRHPKDMLWARCLMRGARRFASHVGTGLAYTHEELADMSAPEDGGEVASAVKDILDQATAEGVTADLIRSQLVKLAKARGLLDADTGAGEPLGKVLGLLWGQARAREADQAQQDQPAEAQEVAAPAGVGVLPCGCPAEQTLRTGQHLPHPEVPAC
jgi:hypothetical protein